MRKKLKDIATVERVRKDKVYPKGTILIQLSATRGQVERLEEAMVVDPKYATINVHSDETSSRYVYIALNSRIPDIVNGLKEGLNIPLENVANIKIEILPEKEQELIVKQFDLLDLEEFKLTKEIEQMKMFKKKMLNGMFV